MSLLFMILDYKVYEVIATGVLFPRTIFSQAIGCHKADCFM